MDEPALLFGAAAGPGSQPGNACRVEVDLIGAGMGSADEGLDVNVHGFGLSRISLNFAPDRSRGALPNLEERGRQGGGLGRGEGGLKLESPTVLFLLHRSFSHHMSLVFIASGLV